MSQTHPASRLLPSPQMVSRVYFPLVEWMLHKKLLCDKAKLQNDRSPPLLPATCKSTSARQSESGFHPVLWSWFSAHSRGLGQASIRHDDHKQIQTRLLGKKRNPINTPSVRPIDRNVPERYKGQILIMTSLSDLEC